MTLPTTDRPDSSHSYFETSPSHSIWTKAHVVAFGVFLGFATTSGGISGYIFSGGSIPTTVCSSILGLLAGGAFISCSAVAKHSYDWVRDLSRTSPNLPNRDV